MKTLNKKQNKLGTYLTVGLGAGCLAGNADAATVQLYGPGATPPEGIQFGLVDSIAYVIGWQQAPKIYFSVGAGTVYFNRGNEIIDPVTYGDLGFYHLTELSFINGAVSGSVNYANISFNGNDGVYEAVGQFSFDGQGGGYLIALAKNNDGSALSISAGKTAIDAVPEPSSLGLLALGAAGLMARRRRVA